MESDTNNESKTCIAFYGSNLLPARKPMKVRALFLPYFEL